MNPKILTLVVAGMITLNACGCPLERKSMAQAPSAAPAPCNGCEVPAPTTAPVVVRYEYPILDGMREMTRRTVTVIVTPFALAKWIVFGPRIEG